MTKSQIPKGRCWASWEGVRVGIWGLGFGVFLMTATGCAARAAEAPVGPPLDVPSAPERVLAPVEEAPVAAAPVPETPPAVVAPRPAPATRPPAPAPPAQPAAAPAPPPATTAAPTAVPRDLRAASPANTATEGSVRELLARAARDINQVNYNRLSSEGRAQYDQSKRFSIQAEQALRERNLVFAATLADKAATLAAELLGR
jgi:hypothetical protein